MLFSMYLHEHEVGATANTHAAPVPVRFTFGADNGEKCTSPPYPRQSPVGAVGQPGCAGES